MRLIRVAVPVPALEALTYHVPDELGDPPIGARVLVPLGRRTLTGVVIESGSGTRDPGSEDTLETADPGSRIPDPDSVKPMVDILDDAPFLPADVVALASWVAEYYACGVGEAIAAAMPPRAWVESERYARLTEAGEFKLLAERGVRREMLDALIGAKPVRVDAILGNRRGAHAALLGLERDGLVEITRPLRGKASAYRTVRVATLSAQGHDVVDAIEAALKGCATEATDAGGDDGSRSAALQGCIEIDGPRLGTRQREALELLQGSPNGIDTAALDERGISAAILKRLSDIGLVLISRRRVDRDPFEQGAAMTSVPREPLILTDEQTGALDRLQALASEDSFQTVLLHGVTGSGKTELYLRLADSVRRAGRSVLMLVPEIALTPAVAAVFRAAFGDRVAIQHSGLSDGERHDQWQRIRRGDVDVVVGTRSAVFAPVRSLGLIVVDEEHDGSYKQEETPRYHGRDVAIVRGSQAGALVVLGSATPSLESFHNARNRRYTLIALERRILDRPMASVRIVDMREVYAASGPGVILSGPLCGALGDRLERGEQSIVLLNRRGFASSVFCRECASTLECPNCSVSLTVHRAARKALCHYCNHSMALPKTCAHCAGPFLEQIGFGTERVEAEIIGKFPGVRVARVDRDTVRKRGAIAAVLSRFAAGEIDMLVGTQMIAKGHDFPRVTLVGVISADVGLGHADFRAAERTFQLLTQVAGRAGRGEIRGEAIVQTLYPKHYSIRHACRQDYAAFYEEEIGFRRSMRYPPSIAMINTVVKARTREAAMHDARELVLALRAGGEPYRVLGPAPAPLSRLKGEHRAQFFLKGTHRPTMRQALQLVLASRPEIRRRTIVDVDPGSVL
jgi:primosomal protein N' (replication factor Y)